MNKTIKSNKKNKKYTLKNSGNNALKKKKKHKKYKSKTIKGGDGGWYIKPNYALTARGATIYENTKYGKAHCTVFHSSGDIHCKGNKGANKIGYINGEWVEGSKLSNNTRDAYYDFINWYE